MFKDVIVRSCAREQWPAATKHICCFIKCSRTFRSLGELLNLNLLYINVENGHIFSFLEILCIVKALLNFSSLFFFK